MEDKWFGRQWRWTFRTACWLYSTQKSGMSWRHIWPVITQPSVVRKTL